MRVRVRALARVDLFLRCDRLELLDAGIRHQREKEMAVSYDLAANVAPLLDDLIV